KSGFYLKKKNKPLFSFQHKITNITRNFYGALKKQKPFFILECKKKSPSLGLLRKDFNLYKIAQIYKKYASAVSVLTDEKYFNGDFKFIKKIRHYLDQPILCKDFFIDPYQVYLARYYHADAILLMLSILNNDEYLNMSHIAKKMNMDVLTEIHTQKELKRAIDLNAKIIGINNRNLHDLSINLQNTSNLAPLIPNNITVISESGLQTHRQIKYFSKFVGGFLIGSQLMSKKNLDLNIRSIIFGNNKICGLTRNIDAKVAAKSGAIYG
ncbi:MAG: bifunctional indole-3-glycerol-phosphate synthase TrpC/phosphoribosylanthranilate isomerase TrpF, partial [Buchnera aphidicola]|nr:bifunctional indole-3-glycerol-phosphate synthase TrpC/phosphoribosylanthranilate isomerase TrpF [Buchnera aphidicola]